MYCICFIISIIKCVRGFYPVMLTPFSVLQCCKVSSICPNSSFQVWYKKLSQNDFYFEILLLSDSLEPMNHNMINSKRKCHKGSHGSWIEDKIPAWLTLLGWHVCWVDVVWYKWSAPAVVCLHKHHGDTRINISPPQSFPQTSSDWRYLIQENSLQPTFSQLDGFNRSDT